MSKIGRVPVTVIEGVTVTVQDAQLISVGPKGALTFRIPTGIAVEQENGKIVVSKKDNNMQNIDALFGLTRATIANMITGVSKGFEKKLELSGVGYRAQAAGKTLTLSVGFSHQVVISADESITFHVNENIITISGIDKNIVGLWAAKVRAVRPPEPYKGKGISYKGERIRRKAGKAAKAVGGVK